MSQVQEVPGMVGKVDNREEATFPEKRVPLWRNRDYMLLWSGQMVSSIGTRVSMLAFPLLVLAITHSPAQAGLIAALRGLPYALFILPAGALVDRWDRKRVMILCDTGRALALVESLRPSISKFKSATIRLARSVCLFSQALVPLISGTHRK